MKLSLFTFILIFCFAQPVVAQNTQKSSSNETSTTSYEIDYTIWEQLLNKHVDDKGFVNYQGFKDDKDKLHNFTKLLLQNTPQNHWSDNQKKAYLINMYNAFTIQLVVKHYPVESIKDIGGFLENVFKIDFINFEGNMISLDDVEKGMLLPIGDPRVHFAVNCASFSCPKLDNKAYKPKNLNQHLEQAAKNFINSNLNILSPKDAKLSKIFKWYKSDFEIGNKSLIDFINKYSKIELENDINIDYLDYNWKLNSKENANNF